MKALDLLPFRTAGAAENMAVDFLLLQRHPDGAVARFRHYAWRGPAFTFGYSQKVAQVRAQLPPGETLDLCRRPTGGGIVDHRDDWTFTLVIPRGHPLEDIRAGESYRRVHECLAEALRAQGVAAGLKRPGPEAGPEGLSTVCFQRAEVHDVVDSRTGAKIAGAAQKRGKHGLLFQGSVWRPAAGGASVDWDRFQQEFGSRLGELLGGTAEETPWPDLDEDEVSGLTERYSSPEWMEFR